MSVFLAAPSQAQESRFVLHWAVPAECSAQPDVSAFAADAVGEASVEVKRENLRWRLELQFLRPHHASRVVLGDSCQDLAKAALLLLELGIRGALPPSASTVAAEPAAPPPKAAGLSIHLLVSAFAAGQFGELPVAAGGACWLLPLGSTRLGPCVAGHGSWWLVTGEGVNQPAAGSAPFLSVGPSVRMLVPLWRKLTAGVEAGISFAPLRPQVRFEGYGVVVESSLISGNAQLLLGWNW